MFELNATGKTMVTFTALQTTDDLANKRPRREKDANKNKTDVVLMGPSGKPLFWMGEYVIDVPGLGGGTATVQADFLTRSPTVSASRASPSRRTSL